jgi:hypothetical protein
MENRRILLFGCGGGFDIFGGYFLFREWSKTNVCILANYSFTDDLSDIMVRVSGKETRTANNQHYFPEADLAAHINQPVYAMKQVGPPLLQQCLQQLICEHRVDLVVAIDAGHDAILLGDEIAVGTPLEDSSSMLALKNIQESGIDVRIACISATTEQMDWALFQRQIAKFETLQTLCADASYADEFEALLNSTPAITRSIPNECLLAALRGVRQDRFVNERLKLRLGTDPITYPDIRAETAIYYLVDIRELFTQSRYYTQLRQTFSMLPAEMQSQLLCLDTCIDELLGRM